MPVGYNNPKAHVLLKYGSLGRLDDQIILLNGEKTNPGPMGMFSA
jgi:hypothetical protein